VNDAIARLGALSPAERAQVLAKLPRPTRGATAAAAPARADGPVARPHPGGRAVASPGQEQQWFLHELSDGAAAYIVPFSLRLRGPLDVEALRDALRAVPRRHQVLRSRFLLDESGVQQVVEDVELDVPVVPLGPGDDLDAVTQEFMRTGFDLTTPHLVRATILRLAADDHVVLWTAHHAVADGWSVGVLIDELGRSYRARIAGDDPTLPEPPVQYADVADWQRERAAGQEADLDTWAERLRGVPAAALPADRPRPARQSFAGDTVTFAVPAEIATAVGEIARRHGTTLYATLLAGLGALLVRHGSEGDAVIGGAFSGRSTMRLESLIGPLATTVPLRVDASGDPAFAELVDRTRDVVLDGFAAQELPFGSLVARLGRTRDLGRNPLYDVLFSMGSLPLGSGPVDFAEGLTLQPVGCPNGTSRLDLELTMEQAPDGLSGRLDYNSDLYERSTAAAFVDRFVAVLAAACADEQRPISSLPLLSDAEADAVIRAEFGRLPAEAAAGTFLGRFAARVEAHPEATAVTVSGTDATLTFAALDRLSDRVAAHLTAAGAGPGSTVAVGVARDARLLPTLLGVLRSGAAYLPLDPEFPPERTEFMLRDSGAGWLVTAGGYDHLQSVAPHVVPQEALFAEPGPAFTRPGVPPAAPAYVMYTSGSTGRPKGVVISHRALGAYVAAMGDLGLMAPGDRTLALARLPFDGSVSELFLPLALGATIVVAQREVARDGIRLARDLATEGITVLHGTPATWRLLMAAGWDGGGVHTLLSGAEAISPALSAELTARVPAVWNLYGPTECTVWALAHRLDEPGAPPIGRPVPGVAALVLDAGGRPVPAGVLGELHLAGDMLADGYLNRPDLTAERFVDTSFGRRYRTGDLVRADATGRLHYVGRGDGQIKIRGHRVEIGEVENVLAAQAGIREAVVVARELEPGDRRLVAYVLTDGRDLGEARADLARRLPDYMHPWRIEVLDAFPLTLGGKIDRRALAARDLGRLDLSDGDGGASDDHRPPSTATEEHLAAVWGELLTTDGIGVDDDFFRLGGHSLLALRLLRRVEADFGVTLGLDELFRGPTIARFALRLDIARARREPHRLEELVSGLSDEQVEQVLAELEDAP
jgi:amino acid adenylation domain-containing protein